MWFLCTWVVFGRVGTWGHLCGGRSWKNQDVGAGSILWGVELGRLQVEGCAAAEH